MTRRDFINNATAAAVTTAGALTTFESVADANKAAVQFENKLSLKVLGTNWGFQGTTDQFCAAVKKEGYDGIEMWWQGSKDKQKELFDADRKSVV